MQLPLAELVQLIENFTGTPLAIPDLNRGLHGLRTGGGLLTERSLNAFYCAYRAQQVARARNGSRILEIGGGMGYVAYFAFLFGCREFTLVDTPLSNLLQAWFLMRALGADQVVLAGEPEPASGGFVRIASPDYLEKKSRVDLVVNIDGFTEYGMDTAANYFDLIRQISGALLSVNHEANRYRVRDLTAKAGGFAKTQRHPYWMRRGYVEELTEFRAG
jgi:hypothetical protein